MDIPKEIKKSIMVLAKYSAITNKLDEQIRVWFVENEINNDSVIDQYIDSVERGGNSPKSFITFLENYNKDDFDYEGNSHEYTDEWKMISKEGV